jgi:Skp family chaperone for outer membrane proteins
VKAAWIPASLALLTIAYSLNASAQIATRGPSKIASISVRRILTAAPEVLAALQKFQATRQQKLTEIQAKQRALADTRAKLGQSPTAAERTKLIQQEQEQMLELDRLKTQSQTDIQASQQEAQNILQGELNPVVGEIVKQQGIDVVLNADVAVFWGSPQLDITAAVIDKLQAANRKGAPPKR